MALNLPALSTQNKKPRTEQPIQTTSKTSLAGCETINLDRILSFLSFKDLPKIFSTSNFMLSSNHYQALSGSLKPNSLLALKTKFPTAFIQPSDQDIRRNLTHSQYTEPASSNAVNSSATHIGYAQLFFDPQSEPNISESLSMQIAARLDVLRELGHESIDLPKAAAIDAPLNKILLYAAKNSPNQFSLLKDDTYAAENLIFTAFDTTSPFSHEVQNELINIFAKAKKKNPRLNKFYNRNIEK